MTPWERFSSQYEHLSNSEFRLVYLFPMGRVFAVRSIGNLYGDNTNAESLKKSFDFLNLLWLIVGTVNTCALYKRYTTTVEVMSV